MAESSQEGLKTLQEKEKLLVTSNSSFSQCFQKTLYCRHVKTRACLGKELRKEWKSRGISQDNFSGIFNNYSITCIQRPPKASNKKKWSLRGLRAVVSEQ